jgi:choice-of-anchor B domain-containing protein
MEKYFIRKILLLIVVPCFVYTNGSAQSQELQLLANFNGYSSTGYNDCWGYTAPDGREYALLGVLNGTSFLDITDPANIVEIDFFSSATSTWKDMKTYQHYAYAVTDNSGIGLQIFDLSNLPNSVTELPTYTGFLTSHNIYIDEENAMLYAQGGGAVRAISLANPVSPVQMSTFGIECHDIYARNNIVYVSEGSSGSIGIYDLSNPSSPSLITRINVPNSGYVHNTWLSDDGNYVMSTEETSGKTVKYWDIHNISNAFITDEYLGGSSLAHNTHVKGNYAYISHYESGLKVVDISEPDNIFEVGYYDTYPQSEVPSFNGAWGAFPFFSSGKVLISDRSTGLYVVYFEGAADADKLDPDSPQNFVAYSDYSKPNSMLLTWNDPTSYFGGNPLSSSEITIEIERNEINIASVAGATQTYTDNGLTDGTLYDYRIYAKIIATDSMGLDVSASWIAGGSPVSAQPTNLEIISAGGGMLKARWINPTTNDDGTPLDDFDAINLYENGSLLTTLSRSTSDTGKTDSTVFMPVSPNIPYYVTAIDNETPSNESAASNPAYPPVSPPYLEDFENATPGTPGTLSVQWTNETDDDIDWYVNEGGTPSSNTGALVDHTIGTATGNYMYIEATSPNFPNIVAHLTTPLIDLSTLTNPVLIFWYHMYGAAMGELHVDVFANGVWNMDVMLPLVGQQQLNQTDPWEQAVVDLSSYTSEPVQIRFRGITGTNYTSDMAIDDVSFEGNPSDIKSPKELVTVFALKPNYPNPFNPTTTIAYQVPHKSDVRIEIYNTLGQKVRTLLNDHKEPGEYQAIWDGRNDSGAQVGSGVYLYRLVARDFVQVRKMILMK